jgi:hypothetical protein
VLSDSDKDKIPIQLRPFEVATYRLELAWTALLLFFYYSLNLYNLLHFYMQGVLSSYVVQIVYDAHTKGHF